jgi:hypothetical protein
MMMKKDMIMQDERRTFDGTYNRNETFRFKATFKDGYFWSMDDDEDYYNMVEEVAKYNRKNRDLPTKLVVRKRYCGPRDYSRHNARSMCLKSEANAVRVYIYKEFRDRAWNQGV